MMKYPSLNSENVIGDLKALILARKCGSKRIYKKLEEIVYTGLSLAWEGGKADMAKPGPPPTPLPPEVLKILNTLFKKGDKGGIRVDWDEPGDDSDD